MFAFLLNLKRFINFLKLLCGSEAQLLLVALLPLLLPLLHPLLLLLCSLPACATIN